MAEMDWSKYTAPLPVRVPEPMRDELRKAARARGESVSVFVRSILADALAHDLEAEEAVPV